MTLAARRFAVVLVSLLAIAGCSSATFTRLAYNNAALAYTNLGPMLTWMVDDYVDLEGPREDWVRVRVDRLLAWHRAEELPRYRSLLESMLAKSSGPFQPEDVASHQAQLREAYHRVLGHVIPDTAEFIAGMDAADVGHMERKFAEDNRRFARESVRGSPEERVQRRVKRFAGHLESWVGRLTPEQRELLANRYAQMPDLTDELMGERRFRQSEILGLARSKPRRAELEARLRHLLIDTDAWRRPEYAEKLRERDRHLQAMIAELSALMTERQRAHLQKRIRTFLGDISTLTAST